MSEGRHRTFDSRAGNQEVTDPLLRAVLSYAPMQPRPMPHPSEGVSLDAEDGSGSVVLKLACADTLAPGTPGPFGSVFYEQGSFEVVVPQRKPRDGALVMIHLLTDAAPRRFAFHSEVPPGWSLRIENDGSVTAVDAFGTPAVFVGRPWAFDADLHRVPAYYSLEDGTLFENVAISADTVFPVLVDPDPDAILTGDGRLITETWAPRVVVGSADITGADIRSAR